MTEVKLDKTRKLKFTHRALYEMEEKLGVTYAELFQDSSKLDSKKTITVLVWAGLLHNGELSFDEVLDIIPTKTDKYLKVVSSVMEELMYAIGTDEDSKKKVKQALNPGQKGSK